jgi:hypothetical protein
MHSAGTGQCIVDKARRNWCPFCRLQKCMRVNMNVSGKYLVYRHIYRYTDNIYKYIAHPHSESLILCTGWIVKFTIWVNFTISGCPVNETSDFTM